MCKNHVSGAELKTKARLVKSQSGFFQKRHFTVLCITLEEDLLPACIF
jgi:hypothetical protein